ncbi:putative JmjC domain-containing histone demethylation protein 2C [Trachymyrmex cornetzi]|uniref:Putative JmjC domain-containing histone demethylation protein 2C n=1 Tax=Trachymyrmex cornetzi TaxID=471704 RepID=A0A195EDX1_9HYME|nr:putative JmjC domain-containing histone demethylation protein 2C [Trachymyrmex cornetzi]
MADQDGYPGNHLGGAWILVEYDDVEWQRREWLSPHRDAVFSFFLIERGLYWAERPDPRHASLIPIDHHNHANNNHHQHRINGKSLRGATAVADTVAWPALTFYPLVARAELHEDAMPIEFMQDRKLDFVEYSKLKPFTQDWELTKGAMPWGNAVRRWAEMQDGQRILLTTPSVLVGFRVEVYRAEGTTQWYTAVIVGYNESTKDLTVTDDTVLEDHNEDPTLVQMRLIGDGVVESIMRGEVVGMTPRRSRSSTALTHALVVNEFSTHHPFFPPSNYLNAIFHLFFFRRCRLFYLVRAGVYTRNVINEYTRELSRTTEEGDKEEEGKRKSVKKQRYDEERDQGKIRGRRSIMTRAGEGDNRGGKEGKKGATIDGG